MNPEPGLDDRLRDAFQTAVNTVQTIKPEVRLSPSSGLDPSSRRRRERLTMFAPLSAAAAVVLAVGAALAVPHLASGAHHSTATPAASTPAANGEQPPFVLMQDLNKPQDPDFEVRSATTGQLTSTIAPPRQTTGWLAATGTGTGRTFVLMAGSSSGIQSGYDTCSWNTYTLRLTTRGTVASLTPLTIPGTPDNGSMSISAPVLSADGSTLAYVATTCSNIVRPSYQDTIVVASRGTVHRYTVTVPAGTLGGAPVDTTVDGLSLSANGGELSYIIGMTTFNYPTAPGGAWALPTSAPSGQAVQRAHEIFTDNTEHGPWANGLVLSPDGGTGYLLVRTGGPYTLGYVLAAYNTRTGAEIRVVHTWSGLPFQTGTEVVGGDHALITGWFPNQATEVNLVTGAAGTYLPHALAKVAVGGLAW
jgi:hypothetical protein